MTMIMIIVILLISLYLVIRVLKALKQKSEKEAIKNFDNQADLLVLRLYLEKNFKDTLPSVATKPVDFAIQLLHNYNVYRKLTIPKHQQLNRKRRKKPKKNKYRRVV